MFSEKIIVNVTELSKFFNIYEKPAHRLFQFIIPKIQKLLGLKQIIFGRKFWALNNVSFNLSKGETIGIIGRNGSGKSTLLQLICGTLTPSNGSVAVNGRIAALLELGSGFNTEFTGRENVFLSGSIAGISQAEMRDKFSSIEDFADIGDFIDQPVKTYSSGMFVRLAFSTAIHTSPDLLVVDEALAVGDTAFQTKCLTRIRQLQKEGVTILLVTHSTNTLIEYCDRAIYLRHGEIVMDGKCRDVVKKYSNDLVLEEGGIAIDPIQNNNKTSISSHPNNYTPTEDRHISSEKMSILNIKILDENSNEKSTFSYSEFIKLRVSISVGTSIISPCFGIEIKSVDDIVLWSTTTLNMAHKIPSLKKGIHTFEWIISSNFSGNRYVIAIGVGDADTGEYKRHARLPYAGHIDVLPQDKGGSGWLAPCPKFVFPEFISDPRA